MTEKDTRDARAGDSPLAHISPGTLAAYAALAAIGRAAEASFPAAAAHLERCAACRAKLADLMELAGPAYAGEVEPAAHPPAPNLSFLPAPPRRPWWVEPPGRLIVQLSEPELARGRLLVGATRGRLIYRYVQEPRSVEDLEVTIEVFAQDAGDATRVRVGVDVPSRGPLDQSGSRVTVDVGSLRLEAETDDSGWAELGPIPLSALPQLRVEVAPLRDAGASG